MLLTGHPASQSSTNSGRSADYAVDGNYDYNNYQHTNHDTNPWLRVDLQTLRYVCGMKVWNIKNTENSKIAFNIPISWVKLLLSTHHHRYPC